jgi:gamma-glutamylcysteine synthetase
MDPNRLRRLVESDFAAGSRSTRVAVEQEHLVVDLATGEAVHPDRVREAIAGRAYAELVSFEPGGQVELSLHPATSACALADELRTTTHLLRQDLESHGIGLLDGATTSRWTPRFSHSPRYGAMERHFDSLGTAGRRMMRATASTQVCLDRWPGRAGLEQWRVLLLAGPFLAAAVCHSDRLATWLEVDPTRTAFDGRLLHGDDPVTAYVDLARRATPFVRGERAHLTTLFPPVRPRSGYLEVRFPDARPAHQVQPLVSGLAALLYDDQRRAAALTSLQRERSRIEAHWAAAAARSLDPERGLRLLGLSRTVAAA